MSPLVLVLALTAALPAREVELVDQWAEKLQATCHAPGLSVAVVRGNESLSKGYGWADVEAKTPVDADRTRFALASVTKTVTAATILTLVNQGQLGLQADLSNAVEGVAVPSKVTLHQLLTHTSGFDDSLIGAGARTEKEVLPLRAFLHMRGLVSIAKPGTLWSYSNRNYSLAGAVAERAVARPFADVVTKQIFEPLHMTHSGFSTPSNGDTLTSVYDVSATSAQKTAWPWTQDVPAGGMNASASDMARFVSALLGGGGLPPAVVDGMQKTQHQFVPGVPGITYGLMESSHGGRAVLMHEGNMGAVSALLVIVPQLQLGYFAAVNGGGEECDLASLSAVLTAREAEQASPSTALSGATHDSAAVLEGTYRDARYPHSTFEKIAVVLGLVREITVRAQPDGTLRVGRGAYRAVGEGLFTRIDGDGQLGFRDGAFSTGAATTYERVPWASTASFNRVLGLTCLSLFLLGFVLEPLRALWGRVRRSKAPPASIRRTRWLAWCLSASALVFTIGLALPFFGDDGPFWLLFGVPGWVELLFWWPYLLVGAAVLLGGSCVAGWKNAALSRWQLLWPLLQLLAGVAFVSFAARWHLVAPWAAG